MTKKNSTLDAILSMLPSLNDKDKTKLKRVLEITELSACERLGHSFKPVKSYSTGFLGSGAPVTVMACSKCGTTQSV